MGEHLLGGHVGQVLDCGCVVRLVSVPSCPVCHTRLTEDFVTPFPTSTPVGQRVDAVVECTACGSESDVSMRVVA